VQENTQMDISPASCLLLCRLLCLGDKDVCPSTPRMVEMILVQLPFMQEAKSFSSSISDSSARLLNFRKDVWTTSQWEYLFGRKTWNTVEKVCVGQHMEGFVYLAHGQIKFVQRSDSKAAL